MGASSFIKKKAIEQSTTERLWRMKINGDKKLNSRTEKKWSERKDILRTKLVTC